MHISHIWNMNSTSAVTSLYDTYASTAYRIRRSVGNWEFILPWYQVLVLVLVLCTEWYDSSQNVRTAHDFICLKVGRCKYMVSNVCCVPCRHVPSYLEYDDTMTLCDILRVWTYDTRFSVYSSRRPGTPGTHNWHSMHSMYSEIRVCMHTVCVLQCSVFHTSSILLEN